MDLSGRADGHHEHQQAGVTLERNKARTDIIFQKPLGRFKEKWPFPGLETALVWQSRPWQVLAQLVPTYFIDVTVIPVLTFTTLITVFAVIALIPVSTVSTKYCYY